MKKKPCDQTENTRNSARLSKPRAVAQDIEGASGCDPEPETLAASRRPCPRS